MRFVKRTLSILFVLFILPALLSLAVWQADASKPASWRNADWSSSGVLPQAGASTEAVIYVMAARTGRWKGAFSVHSWIVLKEEGALRYDRYDVVGWGRPVRHNAYAADARWYSNEPEILRVVRGKEAGELIPRIRAAIAAYPKADYGDYRIWPGPNSNSFVSHVLNEVPDLGMVLPPNAVGRDWLGDTRWFQLDPGLANLQVSFAGFAGFAIGRRHGFELNFLGLVTGIDVVDPALKLPGFGRIGIN